jgi:DNA ligase D
VARASSAAALVDVAGHQVSVSNPEKVYFPARGETKLNLVQYFVQVGEGILGALRDRPVHLERYPEGVGREQIYQKRVPRWKPEWLRSATIRFPNGRTADALCPADLAHVVWAANLGTLSFHPWPTRCDDNDRPDLLRIDLDPQPGTGFAEARAVATTVHELLDELRWAGWPKTSGGRGIHVLVPIHRRYPFDEVRRAAIAFAREVERRRSQEVTTSWWKEERGRRVFIDYNQTARDRTIVSAYSVRPRADATVSAPVEWAELAACEPEDFTIATLPARLAARGDLLAGIDERPHELEPVLEWAERDRRDRGLGDMPYPPNFPKMEGEPMRVQPSRARRVPPPSQL